MNDYPATGPQQARLQAEFLAALTDRADAISRFGPPAHLTVGVAVLDPSGRRVLLTHHRKADAWYQFGGHIEPGDASLRAAAERELREESGLTDLALSARPVHLDRHALPGAFGTCREHLDVRYAAVAAADAVPLVSPESYDVRWFDLDALPPGTADEMCIRDRREMTYAGGTVDPGTATAPPTSGRASRRRTRRVNPY